MPLRESTVTSHILLVVAIFLWKLLAILMYIFGRRWQAPVYFMYVKQVTLL